MNIWIDTIVFLLWGLFFVAAVFGLIHEYQQNNAEEPSRQKLEDQDPVYLLDTFVKESIR